jgi:polyhydroxyalkanoate synthesis repressor PhaR
MGPAVTSAPERHLIKKYANRKLYDTRTSRYITLEEISELVRDGHEIKVVDRNNGNDLTQVTLSQIVLSREKRGPGDAIHDGGQTLLDYVRKTLNVPSDLRHQMEKRREDLEERADETIERALKRLRIPTHTDIERINARLDRMTTQLKQLGVQPATTRSRKQKASR